MQNTVQLHTRRKLSGRSKREYLVLVSRSQDASLSCT
jgi:hypothetical protein